MLIDEINATSERDLFHVSRALNAKTGQILKDAMETLSALEVAAQEAKR